VLIANKKRKKWAKRRMLKKDLNLESEKYP